MDALAPDLSRPTSRDLFLPDSVQAAHEHVRPLIGLVASHFFVKKRSKYWDALAASSDPEVKLACQRMIDALGKAQGMAEHEAGARIAAENRAAQEARREDAALARWRE